MQVPNEIQAAYFMNNTSFSLHSGYYYDADEEFGFCSISSSPKHTAEAVVTALRPIIDYCVSKNKKKIFFITDSTVAQYRNKTIVYLFSSMAKEKGLTIQWVYTEAGHGKSPADGISGTLKTTMRQEIAFKADLIINNVEDVVRIVQPKSTIRLSSHTAEDIAAVKDSFSGILSPLKDALKIHVLFFSPTLSGVPLVSFFL